MKRFLLATVIALSATAPAIAEEWVEFRPGYQIDLESVTARGGGAMSVSVRQDNDRGGSIYRDVLYSCRGKVYQSYILVLDRRVEVVQEALCGDLSRCAINPSPTDRALEREICFE